jgi:diaminopropionate ammonia-lyase
MAALLGAQAGVVVPDTVPPAAVALIDAEGASVVQVAGSYDDAVAAAAAWAGQDPRAELVQDTAWPGYEAVPRWIVEGYSTLMRESQTQLQAAGEGEADLVVVPVGVGSLAEAVVRDVRSREGGERTAVLSAEPDTAACVLASLLAGAPRTVPTAATVMAGLNCGTVSTLAWPVLQAGLDAAVAVPDRSAQDAALDLAAAGVSSGPSGAATLAAARWTLTGAGSARRRSELAVGADAVVVLLNTEGRDSGSTT